MSADMIATASDLAMNQVVSDMIVAGLLAAAVLTVVRVVALIHKQTRRHRHRANRRFIAGYRAGFQAAHAAISRTTVSSVQCLGSPVVRPRAPADAGEPRPPASAGSKRRGRMS